MAKHIIRNKKIIRCSIVIGNIGLIASLDFLLLIIDHKGLETLKGCGDSIVKLGLAEYHTQIAYPENELIAKMIQVNRG